MHWGRSGGLSRTGRGAVRVARNAAGEVVEVTRFATRALRIDRRRRCQTVDDVARLRARHRAPLIGDVYVWDLVEALAGCVDPTDCQLLGASQQVHVRQMLEAMDADGVVDTDMLLAAVVHDLGKLALDAGEDPADVVGPSAPIGEPADGVGLDHVVFQWGHAELAYERFRPHVPPHVAWLIRHHNLTEHECRRLMDERDRHLAERYLAPFQRYDRRSKSAVRLPPASIHRYRDLVEKAFPDPIIF
jgi:hypothetical protein